MRIGIGYDVHRFVEGRKFILGGVEIPHKRGLLGHSDGDALCHAIADAILGAKNMGDIGKYFPDTDPKIKGISSLKILEEVKKIAKCQIINIDAVIVCEEPKLSPYLDAMREKISSILNVDKSVISIKVKRGEGMGFVGRGEGIICYAVCLIE